MSQAGQDDEMPAEQRVARLFETAGYEVAQAVGIEPGTVDWYATPRTGFVRPRTYWLVWNRAPADPGVAMSGLEQARIARKADRALAILISCTLPEGYEPDLHGRTSNMVTYRRLALEISDIAESVRKHAARYEREYGDAYYLPRTGQTRTGSIVDAVDYIKQWAREDQSSDLALIGSAFGGRSTVIERARYEIGLQFISAPETTRPISVYIGSGGGREAIQGHFALIVRTNLSVSPKEIGRGIYEADPGDEEHLSDYSDRIELLPPAGSDVERWFQRRLGQTAGYERFVAARKADDFCRLSNAPANLEPLASAVESLETASSGLSTSEWIVQLVIRYMTAMLSPDPKRIIRGVRARPAIHDVGLFEEAALEQFALGRPGKPDSFSRLAQGHSISAALSTWMQVESEETEYGYGEISDIRFSNQLIWDYFLARRIARAFREGDTRLFARYQFSKEYVLLFLAVLAPEVAAQFTEDRAEKIRAEIGAEVERRLQLTLGHMLKRSVGAIRMHLDIIRETIAPEHAAKLHRELGRIEQELTFQSALAERTGRWQEGSNDPDDPGDPDERVALNELVASVMAPLAQKHTEVVCSVDIDAVIGVRARHSILREILHCLIENAFQAVVFARSSKPEVRVAARIEGETVLVEVIDTGPGVRAADHERVFEPYVTTKKAVTSRSEPGWGYPSPGDTPSGSVPWSGSTPSGIRPASLSALSRGETPDERQTQCEGPPRRGYASDRRRLPARPSAARLHHRARGLGAGRAREGDGLPARGHRARSPDPLRAERGG
jgi:signal transduction histidine kinase